MQRGIRADDAAKGLLPIIKMWRHVGIFSLVYYGWLGAFWEGLPPLNSIGQRPLAVRWR